MERTGRHSMSVCSYKCTSSDQLHQVSSILCGNCSQNLRENVGDSTSIDSIYHDNGKEDCCKIVNPAVSSQNDTQKGR